MESSKEQRWDLWGPLADRYRTPRPRRILSLDGGGIRGLISLGVLDRLESELAHSLNRGSEFRLSEFFDLIGGTSTGAIIAAALARGMSVAELTSFYRDFGEEAFSKRSIFQRWKSLYVEGGLAAKLQQTFGQDTDLSPESLACLLVVVTRNSTTDSAWPISSNPSAKYNDPSRADCNLRIPLWQLLRASTAAPVFFPPEVIHWDPRDPKKSFVFVDGGTTVYNNPSFLLFRMATEPAYRLGWERGERELLVVSVGTGGAPVLGTTVEDPETNLVAAALNTLSAVMSQASVDQDVNCRVIGRCSYGGIVDREIHDVIADDPGHEDRRLPLDADTGKAFLYVRYNAELTGNGLKELGLTQIDPKKVLRMDAVDRIEELQQIGRAVAAQVDLAHLGSFVT